jgi:hypothetical protein
MNPYIRAAQKFPQLRQLAAERLSRRPGRPGRPIFPEVVEDRPDRPDRPQRRTQEPAADAVVVRRARTERGRFRADDPSTPEDEAWEELQ